MDMPSMDFLKPAPQQIVARFESEPAGAEVRASTGGTCRTPCALSVPAQNFSATFQLTGYLPQTVPVQVREPEVRADAGFASPEFAPNPVIAALEPMPPPPKKPVKPKPKRPTAARPAAASPAAARPAAPPPVGPASVAPAETSPWPAPAR